MDSGSTHSFINLKWVNICHLKQIGKCTLDLSTFGEPYIKKDATIVKAKVFKNLQTPDYSTMQLLAIDTMIDKITSYRLTRAQRKSIEYHNLKLADKEADSDGSLDIDILIGQDFYHALHGNSELVLPNGLILSETIDKKYTLGGTSMVQCTDIECKRKPPTCITAPSFVVSGHQSNFNVLSPTEEQETLDRFSSLDVLGINPLEKEISPILEDFNKKTIHNGKRYEVKLPFKEKKYKMLSTNLPMAFNRLASWEAKHKSKSDKTEYLKFCQIMKEQLDLGILEEVGPLGTIDEVRRTLKENPKAYDRLAMTPGSKLIHYLPWHGVYKAQSGKLRIVYDAAAKPYKAAYSLNDCLETGPDLMNSLYHILLKFRKKRFAGKADIQKAFLQVEIAKEHRDALRLLWIKDGVVWVLRFARLPFGLTSSPFILAAVLKKHLESSEIDEELVQHILTSFYVDDNVWSVDTWKELILRYEIMLETFDKAGMKLTQWDANDQTARELFRKRGDDTPEVETVLGLKWDVLKDIICINTERIKFLVGKEPKSKRQFWSFVAQLYDPLGLLSPYTTLAKLLTREVSAVCKGWNSKLPKELSERVTMWMEDFLHIPTITFPRHVGIVDARSEMLVGYCDASMKALGVCIYLVSTDKSGVRVSNLLTSKSRLAPYPAQTIPRLELMGAVLAVKVMAQVKKSFPEIPDHMIHLFSDSRNVIFWIYSGSMSWPPFVANRRKTILEGSKISQWGHVDTKENPADLPSRGCSLQELKDPDRLRLWKHGPDYLLKGIDCGKSTVEGYKLAESGLDDADMPEVCVQEVKTYLTAVKVGEQRSDITVDISKVIDIDRFDKYDKLIGVTIKVLTFIRNLARSTKKPLPVIAEALDLENDIVKQAEVAWIQVVQRNHYQDLFKLTAFPETKVSVAMKGFFKDHNVFLDKEDQLLRVKTRLQESLCPYGTIYPILLPPRDHFTSLYIRKIHLENGHSGVPQTLAYLRSEFWVPQGRSVVKGILHKCVPCRKANGPFYSTPKHPPLPSFRVQKARAFQSIGIDFCGPFAITDVKHEEWRVKFQRELGRRRITRSSNKKEKAPAKPKAYMLIITCAVTRAVHLEATLGMTVNDFLMGFQRFMNVRGVPEIVNSDNAKTFIRSHQELDSIYKSSRVKKFLQQKRIKWFFYTERAPWMGGWIERLNAIFKGVCKKTYGKAILSFDEFRTMVSYSMSVMNDRPLTYVYSDLHSSGFELTPSKLIHGHNLTEPPHLSLRKPKDEAEMELGERYLLLEKLKDSFWCQWSEQYLTSLYERHIKQGRVPIKFRVPRENDIVLVRNEKTPRRDWKLGRVLNVKKGSRDGEVREVTLLTTNKSGKRSHLKRSPTFLVPLEEGTNYIDHKVPKPLERVLKAKQLVKADTPDKRTCFSDVLEVID